MSKKTSGTKAPPKENIKIKIRKRKRLLEHNIGLVQSEIETLEDTESSLCKERTSVVTHITAKVKELKEMINKYTDKLCKSVQEVHDKNISDIRKLKENLEQKRKDYLENIEKCENAVKKPETPGKLVSEKKVLKMVYESLDRTEHVQTSLKLIKIIYDTVRLSDNEKYLSNIIGKIERKYETVNEFQNKIEKIASIECPTKEVTALAWNRMTEVDMWACFGADKELMALCEDGTRLQHITVDFRIDDIVTFPNGTLLATSPDSFCIKRIENYAGDGKKRSKTIIESEFYLHGLTLSVDETKLIVCGTDTPNYSKTKPKMTIIIEYSPEGQELKRIPLRNVNGKVYRIAQNVDQNYTLTFPKDGRVYSFTQDGDVRGLLNKSQALKAMKQCADARFWPSGLCCNSKGNILVSDWIGKRVLVLDGICRFLRYVGDVYLNPNSLALCSNGNKLLVGDQGVIEVWKT